MNLRKIEGVDLFRRDAATPGTTLEARDARITGNRNGGAGRTSETYKEREKGFELSQALEIAQRVRRVVRQVRETIQVPFPSVPFRAIPDQPIPQGNST
jgi:hypothetical protein